MKTKRRDYYSKSYDNDNYYNKINYKEVDDIICFYEKFKVIKDCSIENIKHINKHAKKKEIWDLHEDTNIIINIHENKILKSNKNIFLQKTLSKLDYKNKGIDEVIKMFEELYIIKFLKCVFLYPKNIINDNVEYKLYLKKFMLEDNKYLNNIHRCIYFPNFIMTKKCKICISVELQKCVSIIQKFNN